MKRLLFCLFILAILMLSSTALAADNMVNPHFYEANHLPELQNESEVRPRGRITVDLSMKGSASLNKDIVSRKCE